MKPIFVVPTVRYDLMRLLAISFMKREWAGDFYMLPIFQGYSVEHLEDIKNILGDRLLNVRQEEMGGFVYEIRMRVLKDYPDVEKWIFLDDDMEFTDETDFSSPLSKIEGVGVGIISCNWVRTASPKLRALKRYEDAYVKQSLVNMSGGQVFSREVARALLSMPIDKYMFCDVQGALHAYLCGFENYRYLGSILIHKIMFKGGLKDSYRDREHRMPDPKHITVKRCKKTYYDIEAHNHYMPAPKDVTDYAHRVHEGARAAKGWN